MEGSLRACQTDDCNYHKLKHDTAHRDSLMKAFIGWSTKQRHNSHSLSMRAVCVCEWKEWSDSLSAYLCASMCAHAVVIEKAEGSVCDVTLSKRRFCSLQVWVYHLPVCRLETEKSKFGQPEEMVWVELRWHEQTALSVIA